METPKRYHPLLVTLHWLIAILVLFNLYFGLFVVMDIRNFAQMDANLTIHMTVGIIILVLLVVRLIIRLRTKKPAAATTENGTMDRIARGVHYALYFSLFVMTLAGILYSIQSFSFQSIFLGQQRPAFGGPGFAPGGTPGPRVNAQGTPLARRTPGPGGNGQGGGQRPGEGGFPGGPGGSGGGNAALGFLRGFRGPVVLTIHAVTAVILILLLLFHIGAALYHQFSRKDHLLGRMWYGK